MTYRPAAAVMLLNDENKVFVAQRIDSSLDAWQMPQGGLDPGERARDGALRELEEETGIGPDKVEIVAEASRPLLYELPPELGTKLWGGKYKGQSQSWFLMRFRGTEADIDLDTAHPEFRAYQWVDPWRLPDLIVAFKKRLYEEVLEEFASHLPPRSAA
ncbi:RNA pyrophosphohydrolase [Sphingomonas antarctica]|uniref:RNA pyrophosphohydrolase n=1 Tax=Sphingomonas antarctica TaxID=2040274 RepID=UPI0039E90D4C